MARTCGEVGASSMRWVCGIEADDVEEMEEMVEMKAVLRVGMSKWALLGGAAGGGR